MEITTDKTAQEIFDSMIQVASRKYKIARRFEKCGLIADSEEYFDEWHGILDALEEAFDVSAAKLVRETTRK